MNLLDDQFARTEQKEAEDRIAFLTILVKDATAGCAKFEAHGQLWMLEQILDSLRMERDLIATEVARRQKQDPVRIDHSAH